MSERSEALAYHAYHFVGDKLSDGNPIPADDEWLNFNGEPILCRCGLHASEHPFDALMYAPGPTLCLVEIGGTIVKDDDKVSATRRRIIKRFDATGLLHEFARKCALDVIHLCNAPPVVVEFLTTGDESLRAAARTAAEAAARDTAKAKAKATAWAAAEAAAWAAAEATAGAAAKATAGAAAWAAAWAAAEATAGAAAWNTARDAAWAAAWDTARAAATKKQRGLFKTMVDERFAEMGARR